VKRLPVGLYAALLLAAVLWTFPGAGAVVLESLQRWQWLPLRLLVVAGESTSPPSAGDGREAELAAARARLFAGAAPPSGLLAGLEPIVCFVTERRRAVMAELPSVVVLDRRASELSGCEPFVTHGDALVGFLDPAAPAGARQTVRLLHDRVSGVRPGRVVAAIEAGVQDDSGHEALRFLVEPASFADAWPLRCDLVEDPYRMAREARARALVRTAAGSVPGFAATAVPAGLVVGTLRLWGYPGEGGRPLAVGYYVEPAVDARALASVAVWRRSALPAAAAPARDLPRVGARAAALPGAPGRWYLCTAGPARAGAAVVAGERFLGLVERAGATDALAVAFGVERRLWSLILVPHDAGAAPIEIAARSGMRSGSRVELALVGAPRPLPRGALFTGAHGASCPAGLWIGDVEGTAAPADRFEVHAPELPRRVEVLVAGEGEAE
jgi:hypothetical protein